MTPEQNQELRRISDDIPRFEEVLEEVSTGSCGPKFWAYYYPLCFRYTAEFFKDEEDAREAVLPLFEHWARAAVMKYDANRSKFVTFFERVAKNFCLDFQRDNGYGPELVYNSEGLEMDDDEEDATVQQEVVAFVGDYPTDGVDHDDPETIAIRQESDEQQADRIADIRDSLYPGDQQVFDLLLEEFDSDDIASILERSVVSVENAIRRIRTAIP